MSQDNLHLGKAFKEAEARLRESKILKWKETSKKSGLILIKCKKLRFLRMT